MTDQETALDLASTPVVAVRPELAAMDALYEMYRRDVHHLAVVADEDTVGLVNAADLLQGIAAQYPKTTTSVGSLCPAQGPRVDAADDIGVAAQRMIDAHTDAVLVMRHGRVCGVLTAVDLVRSIAQDSVAHQEKEGSR
ncbi:cyclic nucleotide-binding/CBS domain-containing protein [Saccharopolyspora sp. ASAGF58]|uniref:CBS domain-containing protein n=1 Tax=Saccharopolyspora sp. ASAGF58 TaxID=2719023 RepID=UPI001440092B|nr:CBS domain-containing protein [Saccharopolyspora sp. ASAGF58]QIZ37642.1 CBS domain-containing protein [Saccharopolyspora sp. ASAGF58]QIZ38685.1 CBS domain-containing protein [Saccharopolyspora sp. ASAGF58]